MMTIDDLESLSPTQQLILEVLAARVGRMGETSWPFMKRLKPQLEVLERMHLIGFEAHNTPGALRVWLTDYGLEAVLDPNYVPKKRPASDLDYSRVFSEATHVASIVPAKKMDGGDLWMGICAACSYQGAPTSPGRAYKDAFAHAQAKNEAALA